MRGRDCRASLPHLPFLTAIVRRQELAPNRERGAHKASRGCRGFVGPVPQPLLISRAYSVVPGTIANPRRRTQASTSTNANLPIRQLNYLPITRLPDYPITKSLCSALAVHNFEADF